MSRKGFNQDFHFTPVGAFLAAANSAKKSDRAAGQDRMAPRPRRAGAHPTHYLGAFFRRVLVPAFVVILLLIAFWSGD